MNLRKPQCRLTLVFSECMHFYYRKVTIKGSLRLLLTIRDTCIRHISISLHLVHNSLCWREHNIATRKFLKLCKSKNDFTNLLQKASYTQLLFEFVIWQKRCKPLWRYLPTSNRVRTASLKHITQFIQFIAEHATSVTLTIDIVKTRIKKNKILHQVIGLIKYYERCRIKKLNNYPDSSDHSNFL